MFFLLIFSQDRLMILFQPLRLLTLETFPIFPFIAPFPFIILAEICQPPCLFCPPVLFETWEYTHNHTPGILLRQRSCHRNGKQNSESFFNYDANVISVITMELRFIFFFFAMLVSLYDLISYDAINVKNFHETLRYFF